MYLISDGTTMKITSSSGDGQVRTGESVTLFCSARCTFHQLKVTWFRDDHALSESGPALQLSSLTVKDSGNYTCGLQTSTETRSGPYSLRVDAGEEGLSTSSLCSDTDSYASALCNSHTGFMAQRPGALHIYHVHRPHFTITSCHISLISLLHHHLSAEEKGTPEQQSYCVVSDRNTQSFSRHAGCPCGSLQSAHRAHRHCGVHHHQKVTFTVSHTPTADSSLQFLLLIWCKSTFLRAKLGP